jgi:hypothetical protein
VEGLTLAERKAVTRRMVSRYANASKKGKGQVLDELCALTGWNRDHARKALRLAVRPTAAPKRPHRRRAYGGEVLAALRRVWATLDAPSGKRLAPFMAEAVEALERSGELHLQPATRAQLLRMSAATIDRALAPERRKLQIKGRSGTKPGSLLRRQIPIRTFAEWDEARPGFLEVDLVAHDGGDPRGEFCQTLTLTDVATGWTEVRALRNKAQRWVHEAMADVASALPFPLLGVDSDNGSEFINNNLFAWCAEQEITFTRSRPWRKNDNCFVEQKNWAVVRKAAGYLRYDSERELAVLRELYAILGPYVNYFQPQMKLVEKTRQGAKVRRRYDRAATPYQRILRSPLVSAPAKATLTARYEALNPAALKRELVKIQDTLLRLANRPKPSPHPTPRDHPWRDNHLPEERLSESLSRAISVRQRTNRSRAS